MRSRLGWSKCSASRRNAKWMPARCGARRAHIWWAMPQSCVRRRAGVRATRSTISCETSSMPKRTDLARILLIGSGPIVIGQGAEFDYSGTQAVKALKEEGYEVVLVNSNPATIMTDPEIADRTYIEPVTPEWVRKVIERERPDARRNARRVRRRADRGECPRHSDGRGPRRVRDRDAAHRARGPVGADRRLARRWPGSGR